MDTCADYMTYNWNTILTISMVVAINIASSHHNFVMDIIVMEISYTYLFFIFVLFP